VSPRLVIRIKVSPKLKSVDKFSEYNSMIVRHEYRKATIFQNLVDIVIYTCSDFDMYLSIYIKGKLD